MYTLNHTLEDKVLAIDGAYLDNQGLRPFEQFVQSYATRLETYQNLRDKGATLVVQALRRLAQESPEILQKHGQRCQYDMSEVRRYRSLSILRDDETFFKEQMIDWLDTILMAHKRHTHCATAYRYLLEAINANLPPTNSSLIRPYLDLVVMKLQSHA